MSVRHRAHARVLAVLSAVALSAAGCSDAPAIESDAPLPAFTVAMDARIPPLLLRYDIPGASVAVVRDGAVAWTRAYGVADTASQRPMTAGTVMQVGSISKSVSAWGVMHLVEAERFALDTPVLELLERWRPPDSPHDAREVTIRRLLAHSAGLGSGGFPDLHGDEPAPTIPEALDAPGEDDAARGRIAHEPGSRFLYSNPGYAVLELAIEDVTGRSFPEHMRVTVLEPLGMADSSFDWPARLRPRTAVGHELDGTRVVADRDPHVANANGGLFTTAPDLARWVAASVPGPDGEPPGRGVLRPATVAAMHAPVIATEGLFTLVADAYGLGHFVETLPDGTRIVMHGGQNRGWMAHLYLAPASGDGIVILTNSERSQRFFADVVRVWCAWSGLAPVKMVRSYAWTAGILRTLLAALVLGAAFLALRLGSGIVDGTRRLVWAPDREPSMRALLLIAGLSLATAWWGVAHPFLVALFPVLTVYVAVAASALAALLVAAAALRPVTPAAP